MTTKTDLASLNSNNVVDLGEIRKYWDSYFDAEFQVCSSTLRNTCNKTVLDSLRTTWKSQAVCKNGNVPKNLKGKDLDLEHEQLYQISERYSHTVTNATARNINSAIMDWCFRFHTVYWKMEMVAQEDENKLLDFEPIYNKYIVSKFYSQSIQQQVFERVRDVFSVRYSKIRKNLMASKNIKEITSYAAKEMNEQYRKKGHSEENLMFLTNSRILMKLVDAGERALSRICDRGLLQNTE